MHLLQYLTVHIIIKHCTYLKRTVFNTKNGQAFIQNIKMYRSLFIGYLEILATF